ncbi:MAG TPA: prepilin-type N-terminal cleavage/methylation domain-containing protein [Rhodopila sp.]|nr:prepilin-type N-terminal cleavage/methylation domain-containing protein [Rhodopila sp.]
MSTRSAGFTLLEVIVALVVFGFLIAGLSQTVRFGLGAWRTESRLSDSRTELESVDRALRMVVRNLQPGDDTGRAAIVGAADMFTGISRMPVPSARLARIPVEVGVAVSGNRLVLRWRPYMHAQPLGPGAAPSEATLLDNVARVSIAYWRPAGGWVTAWRRPDLPGLIRLRISFRGKNPPQWPDLVVAPLLSAP